MAITLEVDEPVPPVEVDVDPTLVLAPQPAIKIVPTRKSESGKNEKRCLCTTCSCLIYLPRLFVIADARY
jgi:hypothetical protein